MAEPIIKIALIVCSTRFPRRGPSISTWVHSTLTSTLPPNTTLTILDLADHLLPISPQDTPLPAHQPLPLSQNAYSNPAVNAWSLLIRQFNAFIFVTPQYNFSFPASVKCALDHLYHEWGGKPALIVSYGTRGGTKGAEQLRQVLLGCRMHPWEGCVELSIGTEALGGGVLSESALASWEEDEKKGELIERWRELVAIAGEGKRVVEG